MRVEYEINDERGSYIEHGICQLESIHDILWQAMDNGFEIKVSPFYEEEDND